LSSSPDLKQGGTRVVAAKALIGWVLVALGLAIALLQYLTGLNEELQLLSEQTFGENSSVALGTVFGRAAVYLTGFFVTVAGLGVLASRKPKDE
jgi:hypothetical protein